jgi:hypothetical protein
MMVKADKTLDRMRNNPRDWSMEDLKVVATRYHIDWRQPGGSHVTFSRPGMPAMTIPARKPIKPIYVARFVAMIDSLRSPDDN